MRETRTRPHCAGPISAIGVSLLLDANLVTTRHRSTATSRRGDTRLSKPAGADTSVAIWAGTRTPMLESDVKASNSSQPALARVSPSVQRCQLAIASIQLARSAHPAGTRTLQRLDRLAAANTSGRPSHSALGWVSSRSLLLPQDRSSRRPLSVRLDAPGSPRKRAA